MFQTTNQYPMIKHGLLENAPIEFDYFPSELNLHLLDFPASNIWGKNTNQILVTIYSNIVKHHRI